MVYRFISSSAIVAKVQADLKIPTSDWTADAIDWIAESIDFIGWHGGFEKKACDLKIKNYRAELPVDLYTMLPAGVEFNGHPLPYGTDSSGYTTSTHPRTTVISPEHNAHIATTAPAFQVDPDADPKGSESFNQRHKTADSRQGAQYYLLNGNYLQTSFEEGTVRLHYTAFLLDECGFPMIPDNIYLKEAIKWYIIRQLLGQGYSHPVFNWQQANLEWERYTNRAGNDMAMPDPNKMESLKNLWVRLVPDIHAFEHFYMGNQDADHPL